MCASPKPCNCHESNSRTAICSRVASFSNSRFETPRTFPPRRTFFPASFKIACTICVTVDLPRVPVTPMIGILEISAKRSALMRTGILFFFASAIYGESSKTPAALRIKSRLLKSSRRCSPKTNVTFLNDLSCATDSASCSRDFKSVTISSAPHSARYRASPTPRPKRPRPITVIRFPRKCAVASTPLEARLANEPADIPNILPLTGSIQRIVAQKLNSRR